jgi:uncharacterized membrane protein YfcA
MPVLSSLGVETRLRILVAQVAQVPIALAAVFLFWSLAQIPWLLAAQSAAALAIGTLLGVFVGRWLPAHALRRAAAVLMLSAAGYMMARTIS